MLEITDWTVRRGDRVAAAVASLKVRRGEVVGIAGPSGCGKTSLLLSLVAARAARRAAGVLRWEGAELDPAGLVRRVGCATLTDDRPDARDLSVRAWLGYHAAARGAPPVGPPDAAMSSLGLLAEADTPVGWLPGGLAERLLLARLLLAPPDRPPGVVLIDHPLARLDAAGEFALAGLLYRLRTQRSAVLWAATDKARLERHCDRVDALTPSGGR